MYLIAGVKLYNSEIDTPQGTEGYPWLDEMWSASDTDIESDDSGYYRRNVVHNIVRQYFDDICLDLENVWNNLRSGGKFHDILIRFIGLSKS